MAKNKSKQETKWKNAILRVHCKNNTANGLVEYTSNDIQTILDDWCKTKRGIRYFFIKHDKDVITQEDIEEKDYYDNYGVDDIGTLKAPHFHIVIVFSEKNGADKKTILSKFPYGSCQQARDKYGDCTRAVQYLIHKNNPDKHQYAEDEIITNDAIELENYLSVDLANRLSTYKIIVNMQNGLLKEYQIYDKNIVDDATLNKQLSNFNKAAEIYYTRYRLDLVPVNKDMKLFILQGESRSGKTTYAFNRSLVNGLKLAKSSSSNDYMQNYYGQEAFLLDEFEESVIKPKDLLSFLDPHYAGEMSRRYKNKVFVGKMIFIAQNNNWEDIYKNRKDFSDEQRHALHSRVERLYKFYKTDEPFVSKVEEYKYNQDKRKYELIKTHDKWDYKKFIPGALSTGIIDLNEIVKDLDDDLFEDSISKDYDTKLQEAIDFIYESSRQEEERRNEVNTVLDIIPKVKD